MNRRKFGKVGLISAIAAASGAGNAPAESYKRGPTWEMTQNRLPYSPTVLSIRRHMAPEWYDDAKFGMFIDYGLYSVAGFAPKQEKVAMYPDWYLYNMYHDPSVEEYHKKTWGANFERDDFISKFTAKNFDPESLAEIAEEAGMRYVVPFCKHHDGFCLWPSRYTKRNSFDMGPHRDLVHPLRDACKKRNLKFGFYFSIEEWEYPILQDGKKMARLWLMPGAPDHQIVPWDEKSMNGRVSGKIPVKDFFADYIIPQAKEFIDRYDPDLLWFDGEWATDINIANTPEIVSYFYNKNAGRKEVISNDRIGEDARFNAGDFFTSEYGNGSLDDAQGKLMHKWEDCRGISQSFGYNWQDTEVNVLSLPDIIDMLVRIVSEGGNLLLVVNLDGTGAMPGYIRTRLADIGSWLKVNGEAIYASRPWLFASQGAALRFTQSKDRRYLYAIHKGWPQGEVTINRLLLDSSAEIKLLGTNKHLKWKQKLAKDDDDGGQVVIEVPGDLNHEVDAQHAVVLKIRLAE